MKTELGHSLEFLLRAYKEGIYEEERLFNAILENINTAYLIGHTEGLVKAMELITKK
jgi:hypothetical protein